MAGREEDRTEALSLWHRRNDKMNRRAHSSFKERITALLNVNLIELPRCSNACKSEIVVTCGAVQPHF